MARRISSFWLFVIVTAAVFALHGIAVMLALFIDYRIGFVFVQVIDGPVLWLLFHPRFGLPPTAPAIVIAGSIFWGFVITTIVDWWPAFKIIWRWLAGQSPPKTPQV